MNLKNNKTLRLGAMFALILTVFSGSCKKDTYVETEGICPLVILTNPLNGATSVPLNQVVTAKFNEKMNPATITQSSFVLRSGTVITGVLSYDDATATLSFTPSSPLVINTTYVAKVTTAVKDLNGNALQTDYIWSFSTGAVLLPQVVSTDPLNNATGVALNKVVTATFNMPMDPLTINSTTFTLKEGSNTVVGSVTYSGTTASLTPNLNLISNTVYTATITTGAKNLAATPMTSDYIWTFTTGTTLAPLVISTDPLNNASGVPLNQVISATFNMTMDALTINNLTFTVKNGVNAVSGTVNYSGSTATFTPSVNLLSGSGYTATITTGAESSAGTPMSSDHIWTFNTGNQTGPLSPDLQSVGQFGIIAGLGVSNSAGFSIINDLDVGIYPGTRSSITGFPPATIVNGNLYAADDAAPVPATLLQAKNDLTAVYLYCEGATSPAPTTVSGDQGGKTLAPGIYKSTSTLMIQNGNLTLDAQGNPNAVWIFQIASDFTTMGSSPYPSGSGGNVILSGGAQAKNVYWQVGSSATIGDYTSFQGNILALTSITMNAYSRAVGRMLCSNGSVVLTSTNIINKP